MSFKIVPIIFVSLFLFKNIQSGDIIPQLLSKIKISTVELDPNTPMFLCIRNNDPQEKLKHQNDYLRVIIAEKDAKESLTLTEEEEQQEYLTVSTLTTESDDHDSKEEKPLSSLPATNFHFCYYYASDVPKFNRRRRVSHTVGEHKSKRMWIGTNVTAWCHFAIDINISEENYKNGVTSEEENADVINSIVLPILQNVNENSKCQIVKATNETEETTVQLVAKTNRKII